MIVVSSDDERADQEIAKQIGEVLTENWLEAAEPDEVVIVEVFGVRYEVREKAEQ